MPADINFYHLTRSTIKQTLPKLLDKVLSMDKRGLIVTANEEQTQEVDKELWSSTRQFIPHGTEKDGYVTRQPVYITHKDENPNGADVLLLLGNMSVTTVDAFEKCLFIFDGNDPNQLQLARQAWKNYQAANHDCSYWQQDEKGKWSKK